jgi:hypothetical protein
MPVLTKINTNSIAEDAITGDKFAGDAYLSNTATQNISGTYSENRLYTSDAYTLSANATINSHLTLSTVKSSGDVVLTASGAYTLTGTGVLSAGSLLAPQLKQLDLTGMTGELGSVVTGSPNLNLGNVTGTLGSGVIQNGITDGQPAEAGQIGEFLTVRANGTLINTSVREQCNLTLTAGDWDISAFATFNGAITSYWQIALTTTSAAIGTHGSDTAWFPISTNGVAGAVIPPFRFLTSATDVIYLNAKMAANSGNYFYGVINARRMR